MFSAVKSFVAANWRSGNGFVAMAFSSAEMVISYISLSLYSDGDFSVLKEAFWWTVGVERVCVEFEPRVVESGLQRERSSQTWMVESVVLESWLER